MHKLIAKKLAHTQKNHDEATKSNGKARHHVKLESCHNRHHGSRKHHTRKCKKKHCNYHGLCHQSTEECDIYKACRKYVVPAHCITEKQRLRQVHFIKDTKRCTKKHSLSAKEVKDLNAFVKDKVDKMIKDCNYDMHAMSGFKNLLISSSNESAQSIKRNTSTKASDDEDCKQTAKK
eukprot:9206554-Ditylum_brightwellii.AAC.1